MPVIKDNESKALDVPDIGVTLRTLLGVAAQGYKETKQRRWNIRYKGAIIGSLQVKDTHLDPVKARNAPTKPRKPHLARTDASGTAESTTGTENGSTTTS